MDQSIKDLVKDAKQFAKEKNLGLPARIREKLNELKPALNVLVTERLSVADIQDFLNRKQGLKIGLGTLRQYLKEAYNYPQAKPVAKTATAAKRRKAAPPPAKRAPKA
ncbi:hypothetical protein [Burkholderia cenocepacia]|uniref:hypothetical protein n=1 Tax=Burkholderia cenocepacia TaxID=95486 RepID=UPI000847A832|nr:hypothetical protein [Burkholderia cenocepacia]